MEESGPHGLKFSSEMPFSQWLYVLSFQDRSYWLVSAAAPPGVTKEENMSCVLRLNRLVSVSCVYLTLSIKTQDLEDFL